MIANKHKVVVVLGTYNRGQLLYNSLKAYEKYGEMCATNYHLGLVVIDDGSTDSTIQICACCKVPIHYIKLTDKKNGEWRDSASFLNHGIKYALHQLEADYVFITHPEIIPGEKTISRLKELATNNNTWVNAKCYFLSREQQWGLSKVDWQDNLLNVRKLSNFYGSKDSPVLGYNEFDHENVDKALVWHSWVFGGGSREFWFRFGGLTPFNTWGSVDMDLLNRRQRGNIMTLTPHEDDAIVVHQNHDDEVAIKDMDMSITEVRKVDDSHWAKPELIM